MNCGGSAIDPPDHVVRGVEPVRVLGGQLGLADARPALQRHRDPLPAPPSSAPRADASSSRSRPVNRDVARRGVEDQRLDARVAGGPAPAGHAPSRGPADQPQHLLGGGVRRPAVDAGPTAGRGVHRRAWCRPGAARAPGEPAAGGRAERPAGGQVGRGRPDAARGRPRRPAPSPGHPAGWPAPAGRPACSADCTHSAQTWSSGTYRSTISSSTITGLRSNAVGRSAAAAARPSGAARRPRRR